MAYYKRGRHPNSLANLRPFQPLPGTQHKKPSPYRRGEHPNSKANLHRPSHAQAVERGKAGGVASGQARRRLALIRQYGRAFFSFKELLPEMTEDEREFFRYIGTPADWFD